MPHDQVDYPSVHAITFYLSEKVMAWPPPLNRAGALAAESVRCFSAPKRHGYRRGT